MSYLRTLFATLRFDSDEEERLFAETAYPQWLRYSTVGGILALLFNNAFLLMDYMISPRVFETGVHIRFYMCTTIGLLAVASGIVGIFRPMRWPRMVQEGFVIAASAVGALSTLLVATLSPIQGTLWSLLYHAGLPPVMVFASVVMRLSFRAVCVLVATIMLMHWTALAFTPAIPGAPIVSIMLTVASAGLFMLIFSYNFERDNRHRFEQKRRAALLRDKLQAQRTVLEDATRRDPLTGAINRRGLTAYLDQLAEQATGARQAYAVAMIDVDHFKRYNDGYGHPMGDACLCAVSQALAREAQAVSGMLARWGGEEFVMAWPIAGRCTPDDLALIGQGLCAAVAGIGMPHLHSPTASTVTVSVGMASSHHASKESTWRQVLSDADAALYAAKREGRNRAEVAPGPAAGC